MNTLCYLCENGAGEIPGTLRTGDPLATCAICGVFACEGHGKRDPNVRRFQCVLCVPSLLVASATAQSQKVRGLSEFRTSERDSLLLVEDVDSFLGTWPEFSETVRSALESPLESAQLPHPRYEALWESLPSSSRDLIRAAAAIARRLDLRADELPRALVAYLEANG